MKAKRMFKPVKIAMAAAVAMAIAAPLSSAPDDPIPEVPNPAFQKLDTDRDGYISRDEAAKLRGFEKAVDEADDNRDGKLDRDEFVKAQAIHERICAKAYIDDSV